VSRIVVIGVGSPMEGDRIAWDVIDLLTSDKRLHRHNPADLTVVKADRPGSRLLEYMQGAEQVILLDALQGEQAKAYRSLTPRQLQEEGILLSSHGFGVAEALQLAQVLSSLPPDLIIYGIARWAEPQEIAAMVCGSIKGGGRTF